MVSLRFRRHESCSMVYRLKTGGSEAAAGLQGVDIEPMLG